MMRMPGAVLLFNRRMCAHVFGFFCFFKETTMENSSHTTEAVGEARQNP